MSCTDWQLLKWKSEVREVHFQRGPAAMTAGPHQMLMGVNIFDATVAFLFLNMYVRLINDQITVNTYSVTEDLHFVSEHFYELQGAGTLFANNQRCVLRLPDQERRNKSPAV